MSTKPRYSLVQRTIDLNYANKKRAKSMKWMFVNATFLMIFVYDLSCECPGYTSLLHYVEMVCAGVLAANLVQHLIQLLPRRAAAVPLSKEQLKLLGLNQTDLDSSFIVSDDAKINSTQQSCSNDSMWSVSDADLSLSPRSWRPSPASPRSSSPSFTSSPSSPSRTNPPSPRTTPPRASLSFNDYSNDHFIADRTSLTEYLRQYEERSILENPVTAAANTWSVPPPAYQLATLNNEMTKKSEEGSPQGSPEVWWQLDLDPQRLTQFNLNLRLWIHVTILERLVREIERVDEELWRAAVAERGELRAGWVPLDRLRALARCAALLPYLEPYVEQRYVLPRIRELAKGGCMSAYRWNGGGAGWDESKPTDAELVLHLFATYLDSQTSDGVSGGASGRNFSSEYLGAGAGGGGERRGAGTLGIARVNARPAAPQYALTLGEQRVELPRGRNNLLHTLLCLLAAAARRSPPALLRTHLGPAGLNMLWIIGR